MKKIALTKDQFALVDDEDFDWLNQWSWYAHWERNAYYAVHNICITTSKARQVKESMHRKILGLKHGDRLQVDHKNHNTLDNRRKNLRKVTIRENASNRIDQSKYGVGIALVPRKKSRPFRTSAICNGRQNHIGYFATAKEAQQAREQWLQKNEK